ICAPIGSGDGTGNLNSSQTYPFAPMDSTAAAMVGMGQNNTAYSAAISALNAAAGAACLSDTSAGVSYNATTHTASYPARSPIARPSSGNWTNGAYQFAGGAPPPPRPTYYIAANGSDSNNGTSKTTPWLHAPGMANCTGTCASTTPQPGDSFIFRGGDIWHMQNSTATP